MATATAITETKTTGYRLDLTPKEASFLRCVFGPCFYGDGYARKIGDGIWQALDAAGAPHSLADDFKLSGELWCGA